MKLSAGVLLSSLYCSAAAASQAAHVFIYDPLAAKAAPQELSSVSPETARLILARRLGLSRFHSIEDADDDVLGQLNAYGGRQALFNGPSAREHASAHVLVWMEDVDNVEAIIKDQSVYSADFAISNPPPPSDNDRLIQDMILQAQTLPKKADPLGYTYQAVIETEVTFQDIKKAEIYNDFLSVFRADQSDRASFADISKALDILLQKASQAQGKGWSVTVVLMPPSAPHSKRAANPYGAYGLTSSMETRREKTEALLSLSSSQPSSGPQNPNASDSEDAPTIQQADDDTPVDKSPVLGILPPHFSSLEICKQKTHDCSGHGECKPLRKGEKDGRHGCVCKPDIEHVGEDHGMESKRKVTFWGGPACQKKDVSQPFWLFVGVGVMLAFLISAGIGMLYSMGGEELPSVIGAGVSGPTRK